MAFKFRHGWIPIGGAGDGKGNRSADKLAAQVHQATADAAADHAFQKVQAQRVAVGSAADHAFGQVVSVAHGQGEPDPVSSARNALKSVFASPGSVTSTADKSPVHAAAVSAFGDVMRAAQGMDSPGTEAETALKHAFANADRPGFGS